MKKVMSKLVKFLERIVASPLILHGHLKPAPPRKKLSDVSPEEIRVVVGRRTHVLVMPRGGDHVSVGYFPTGSHIFGRRKQNKSFDLFPATDNGSSALLLRQTENGRRKILRMGTQREQDKDKKRVMKCCVSSIVF
ncbi:unnamed protein product [Microthlaspi erraticum]|uniref:Uncharacterized protein n=1 Tax=Microthlaspi erraticum TaxID=1685480 RepID=A0A6D2HU68_9BRAS|nr:unnamed protein product [Microthlaspi erraticum]